MLKISVLTQKGMDSQQKKTGGKQHYYVVTYCVMSVTLQMFHSSVKQYLSQQVHHLSMSYKLIMQPSFSTFYALQMGGTT